MERRSTHSLRVIIAVNSGRRDSHYFKRVLHVYGDAGGLNLHVCFFDKFLVINLLNNAVAAAFTQHWCKT